MKIGKLSSTCVAAVLTFVFSISCVPAQAGDGAKAKGVVEGNNSFAIDLYKELRNNDGNLFFSPYSVSTALAMIYAGARGTTEQQMADVLNFSLEQERLHPAFGGLEAQLNGLSEDESVELNVVNALWLQHDYVFVRDFLDLVRRNYQAALNKADFKRDLESARNKINTWVAENTDDKIHDLIQPGTLENSTRLVLTNAIYFKGMWASEFQKAMTKEGPFSLDAQNSINAPMMTQKAMLNYGENGALQILELPYVGKELSMIVLLPKDIDGLDRIEGDLTLENFNAWQGGMSSREVLVTLPRFKMESQFRLERALASMGMPDAFGGSVDFSGIDGTKELFISAVVHKAFVDVNEEGTEAAAATAVVTRSKYDQGAPTKFQADRPFLFYVRHNPSGSILFLGRIADPRTQQ